MTDAILLRKAARVQRIVDLLPVMASRAMIGLTATDTLGSLEIHRPESCEVDSASSSVTVAFFTITPMRARTLRASAAGAHHDGAAGHPPFVRT